MPRRYFVYDSKKSGSTTVSHLRFDDRPIQSTYLVSEADLVACHQFGLLDRLDVLGCARPDGILLINSPYPAERDVGPAARVEVQRRRSSSCTSTSA